MTRTKIIVTIFVGHILFQVAENYALLSNPEALSSYALTKEYVTLKDKEIDLTKNCPGFKCRSSGLNHAQISALVSRENEIREKYANDENIANLYSAQWNEDLARLAQARNQLSCMLPPTGNTVIYERVENKWLTSNKSSLLNDLFGKYPVAVEVVMSNRSRRIAKESQLKYSLSEYIDTFNKVDANSNPLKRRGAASDMGCSYLMAGNKSHVIDYMVCLYGYLFFDPKTSKNMYQSQSGAPCSACMFYSTYDYFSETHGQQWACGSRYPHICNNLVKRNVQQNLPTIEFDCTAKQTDDVLKESFFISGDQEVITDKPLPALFRSASSQRSEITLALPAFTLMTIFFAFRTS